MLNRKARMSKDAVAAFIHDLAKDPKLQQELVEFAAKHGYDFTSDELSESDLSGVTGGVLDIQQDFGFKKKPAKK